MSSFLKMRRVSTFFVVFNEKLLCFLQNDENKKEKFFEEIKVTLTHFIDSRLLLLECNVQRICIVLVLPKNRKIDVYGETKANCCLAYQHNGIVFHKRLSLAVHAGFVTHSEFVDCRRKMCLYHSCHTLQIMVIKTVGLGCVVYAS